MEGFKPTDRLIAQVGANVGKVRARISASFDALTGKDTFSRSLYLYSKREERRNPIANLISGYAAIAYGIGII